MIRLRSLKYNISTLNVRLFLAMNGMADGLEFMQSGKTNILELKISTPAWQDACLSKQWVRRIRSIESISVDAVPQWSAMYQNTYGIKNNSTAITDLTIIGSEMKTILEEGTTYYNPEIFSDKNKAETISQFIEKREKSKCRLIIGQDYTGRKIININSNDIFLSLPPLTTSYIMTQSQTHAWPGPLGDISYNIANNL